MHAADQADRRFGGRPVSCPVLVFCRVVARRVPMTLKEVWSIIRDAGMEWLNDNATRLSAALAFYTIPSISPLFPIPHAIPGAIFGQDAATGALANQLRGLLGDAGAEVAQTTLAHANRP